MDIIKFSISKPVTVTVGVILVVLFGLLGIFELPVQLTPDVEAPQITVNTLWPGATPYEVEKDIIEEQEEVLKGIQRLTLMESSSYNSRSEITLTFEVGTDLDSALLMVSNKLNEVRSYPDNVEKPVIEASGANSSPVIWMVLKVKDGDPATVGTNRTFFENDVRQYLERVPGVASLFVFGGSEKQFEIVLSPEQLSKYNLTIGEVISRLKTSNSDISAGILGLDKMNYRVRTVSQFQNLNDALEILLKDDGIRRVRLKDVAQTRFGYANDDVAVMHNALPVIVCGVRKEQGANVIELTNRVKQVVAELNDGVLKDHDLYFSIVYEQTPYIGRAIKLVQENVVIGGILAMIVLLIFLRSVSSTLATAIAIPISVIGTFIFMRMFNRTLNVVSLAGISFAVGMLVDNAIVVLENIDRHRKLGKDPFRASSDGAKEVWGAVLASTATTVAVFLPIIFIEEEAGQLFKDIAIAITFAIMISLIVSVSVIPAISFQLYRLFRSTGMKTDPIGGLGRGLAAGILYLSRLTIKNWATRLVTIALLLGAAVYITAGLYPKAEYLPQGNRNLILNLLIPPPGYSVKKRKELGDYIYKSTAPYFAEDYKDGVPRIKNMFFVAADRITLFGAISEHETEAPKMMPMLSRVMNSIPGVFGVSIQMGIFQSGLGRGRTVDVNISGENIDKNIEAARMLFGAISGSLVRFKLDEDVLLKLEQAKVPKDVTDKLRRSGHGIFKDQDAFVAHIESVVGKDLVAPHIPPIIGVAMARSQVRPVPSLENSYPEANFTPDRSKIMANGMTEEELGLYIDVIMDGRKVGEFKPEQAKKMDMVLRSDPADISVPEDISESVISNRFGNLIRIKDIAELQYGQGMMQIDHLERKRNIKLEVTPCNEIALQEAMEIIKAMVDGMKASGKLDGVTARTGGNADKLEQAIAAIQWNLILAAIIVYLLMAALFENFFYPLIIMFSVPLAAAGGFVGLRLVDTFVAPQTFDIVTMLGFIILVGTVVNNAILIVHQALNNVRYGGFVGIDAVTESVRTRIRPIFMSTATSLFGMLPLVLSTGAGSELYRGLGSVLLGGLAFSTVFTMFMIPALLSFFIGFEVGRPVETDGDDTCIARYDD